MSLFLALKGDSDKFSFTFRSRLKEQKRATAIAIAIVGRAVTKLSNIEKKLGTNVQKIKSDNFCYCKDGKSDNYIGSNRENIFKGTSHFYKI